MIIVIMNLGEFFMKGKPVDAWDANDFDIKNFSLLDELVRNQKVKSIGVALLPSDCITDKFKSLKIRKICDWFKLPIMMSWRGYDYVNSIIYASDKERDESAVEYIAVTTSDVLSSEDPQFAMRCIHYSPNADRDLIMEEIIDKIVVQHNSLISRIG